MLHPLLDAASRLVGGGMISGAPLSDAKGGLVGPRAGTKMLYPINQWDSRTPGIGSAVRAESAGIAAPIANHTFRATGNNRPPTAVRLSTSRKRRTRARERPT